MTIAMRGGKNTHGQRPALDWGKIRRGLEAAQTGLEQEGAVDPEKGREILRARARVLAQEPEARPSTTEQIEILEFLLASETYGIESRYVREVYPLKDFTPVPCTPPFVLGVVNVRGRIVSVIDLKVFWDLPSTGLSDLNKVIIIENDVMELGILADLVVGVKTMSLEQVQLSLPTLTDIRAEYLRGVSKERTVILDAERMLSDKKIIVHERA